MKIKLIKGPAGSGKTYSIPQWIAKYHCATTNPNNNWVISTPSVKAASEIYLRLKQQVAGNFQVTKIDSSSNTNMSDNSVLLQTKSWLWKAKKQNKTNQILVICHATREKLSYELQGTQLIVDDPLVSPEYATLPYDKIHKASDYWQPINDNSNFIRPREDAVEAVKNEHTVVSEQFKSKILSASLGLYDMYMSSYKDPKDLDHYRAARAPSQNYYPSGTIVMGAHVTRDAYYIRFPENCELVEELQVIGQQPRTVKIHYGTLENNTTYKKLDQPEFYVDFLSMVEQQIGDQPVLCLANKNDFSRFDLSKVSKPNWHHLSINSHGLNEYRHISNVVLFGAYNMEKDAYTAFKHLGYNSEDILKFRTIEFYYQAAFRSSLRDLESTVTVNIFVPDFKSADILREMIEQDHGFEVNMIDHDLDKKSIKKAQQRVARKIGSNDYKKASRIIDKKHTYPEQIQVQLELFSKPGQLILSELFEKFDNKGQLI